jgi:hypothetical protein
MPRTDTAIRQNETILSAVPLIFFILKINQAYKMKTTTIKPMVNNLLAFSTESTDIPEPTRIPIGNTGRKIGSMKKTLI